MCASPGSSHLMPEPCVSRLGAIALEFPFGLGPGLLGKRPGKIKPASVNCSHHVYHIGVHRSLHSSSSLLLIPLPVAKAAIDTSISDDTQASLGLGSDLHPGHASLLTYIQVQRSLVCRRQQSPLGRQGQRAQIWSGCVYSTDSMTSEWEVV